MKKIVIIIFLSIMSLLTIPKVNAYEVVTSTTDYYYTRYNSDGTQFSDKATLYFIDDKPVFCIEPGKKLGSNYSINKNYNISYKNKIRIILAANYGYMSTNRKDYRFGLATQSIIWKEITGSYPVYSTKLFGEGEKLDLSYYINLIEASINSREKSMNLVTQDDILVGSQVTFEDLNKQNQFYEAKDVQINYVNGNTMRIAFNEIGEKTLNFKRIDEYNDDYKVFTNGQAQALLMAGNFRDLDYSKTVYVKPINLHFYIRDSETKELIDGATLNLNGESLKNESTYTITDVRPITYKIESVPVGYILNDQLRSFSKYTKENVDITLYVDPIKTDYTIYKTYDEDTPEENAIFELFDSNNNSLNVYETDKNGTFNLSLRYGTYTLKQLRGIDGYSLVNTVIDNTKISNTKNNNAIRLNDEKILNNDSEVNNINEEKLSFTNSDTNPNNLIQTGNYNTLFIVFLFSLICLLSKKIIAI